MYCPVPAPQPQLAWAAGGDYGTAEVPWETVPWSGRPGAPQHVAPRSSLFTACLLWKS